MIKVVVKPRQQIHYITLHWNLGSWDNMDFIYPKVCYFLFLITKLISRIFSHLVIFIYIYIYVSSTKDFFSPDILNDFRDEQGHFKPSLCKDTKGLLQLYEASFLSTKSETSTLLESANTFAMSHLKNYLNGGDEENNWMVKLVRHALEVPLHCMMLRVETRWYIDIYENIPNANPLLIELAKLDFNFVQAMHQQELRNLSRWVWLMYMNSNLRII